MGQQTDPCIDQTRAVALDLFAAQLAGGETVPACSDRAIELWRHRAVQHRDIGLVRLLDALDPDTFRQTWRALVQALLLRGRPDMLRWLRDREAR
jgi:hypothetical protein